MAKFCGTCGSKLVNEKCPNCDKKVEKVEVVQNEGKTNGLSVAGFVLSLVSLIFGPLFSIVGLILSIVGLNQIKKTNEEGKGLAIAGIIISAVDLFLYLLVLFFVFIIFMAGAGYYY